MQKFSGGLIVDVYPGNNLIFADQAPI